MLVGGGELAVAGQAPCTRSQRPPPNTVWLKETLWFSHMCKTCAFSQGKSYSFSSLVLILEKAPDGNNKHVTTEGRDGRGTGLSRGC